MVKVRLLNSGDAKAYCKDGHAYLIAPTAALFAEVRRTFQKGSLVQHARSELFSLVSASLRPLISVAFGMPCPSPNPEEADARQH